MKFAKKILCIVLCAAFLFASYGCKANPREESASTREGASYVEESASKQEDASYVEESASTQEETSSVEESADADAPSEISEPSDTRPDENGVFDDQYEVALYIYYYNTLPRNYITKKEAKALGWEGGGLEAYAPGRCIGGDYFGNYEGLLPEEDEYRECDIDTLGKDSRGAKRIIYSEDGDVYYTSDHYESFTEAYFEEDEKGSVTVDFKEME